MEPITRPHRVQTVFWLVLWLGLFGVIFVNRQGVVDWWKLRGYVPPAEVSEAATAGTMTDYARHLLYVNKPAITSGSTFSENCPVGTEKTVVLGCYRGGDAGIYLYNVTDPRLKGVVEVTAAHEMLHAAYARLSTGERTHIDTLLSAYYAQSVSDERIRDTIAAYQKTEPDAIANEMHSIFATEIRVLPPELETYYKKYFVSRATVVAMTERYQGEFTSRKQRVAEFDSELRSAKSTIDANEAALRSQHALIVAEQSRMERLRYANVASYNADVDNYNQMVAAYNALLQDTKQQIDAYNTTVEKRNALALEERQLTQALTGKSLPSAQ